MFHSVNTDRADNLGRAEFKEKVWPSVVIGLLVGGMAGMDSWVNHKYPFNPFKGLFGYNIPYLYSIIILFLLLLGLCIFFKREELFQKRFFLSAAAVVLPAGFGGISYGPLHLTHFFMLPVIIFFISVTLVEQRGIYTPLPVISFLLLLGAFIVASIVNGLVLSIVAFYTLLTKILVVLLITNLMIDYDVFKFALKCFMSIAFLSAIVAVISELVYLFYGYAFTMDQLPEFHYKHTPFGKMLRVTAFMSSSQNLSHLVILGASLYVFSEMSPAKKTLILLTMATAVLFSFSSAAYLVFGGMLALALFIRKPSRWFLYLAVISFFLLVTYETGVLKFLYQNILVKMSGKNVDDRIEYLQVGIEALKRHPFLGIGLKNIGRYSYTPIHNAYAQVIVDIGIFGGMIFLFFVLYLLVTSIAWVKKLVGVEEERLVKGLLLGICALCMHFLFEPFYDNLISWMFMGFAAALPAIFLRKNQDEKLSYGICRE